MVFNRVFKATYLIFLSVFNKNRPKILIANTLSPDSDLMSIIDNTVSYKIVFPTFLLVSVVVATCARTSFIVSEASGSFLPSILRSLNILTCKQNVALETLIKNEDKDKKISNKKYVLICNRYLLVRKDHSLQKHHVQVNNQPELSFLKFLLSLAQPTINVIHYIFKNLK